MENNTKGWVTVNGRHILYGENGEVLRGRAIGWGSPREEFNFVQRRLAAGGLKRGERRMLERRSERLAKEVLGVTEEKSIDTQMAVERTCNECINFCVDCINKCEACPNKDAKHKECMQMCKMCIAACTECIAACSGNTPDKQTMEKCRKCTEMCMKCVEMLEELAEMCPICKATCEACSESCGVCAEMCNRSATGEMDKMQKSVEVKRGARHSGNDLQDMQTLHDIAKRQGASCEVPKSIGEDGFVSFGDEVKATQMDDGNVKLAGYLIRFSDAKSPDLTGDYFTKSTDFGAAVLSDAWLNHRMPITYKGKRATYKEQLPDAELTKDDIGIFATIILGARNEYEKMLAELGLAGKLGWSSGTAPHLVDRKQVGNAYEITRWKLGLDASLTPTPAEYRNSVVPMKSLIAHEAAMTDKGDEIETTEGIKPKEIKMEKEEFKALLDENAATLTAVIEEKASAAATQAVRQFADSLPEIKTAMNVQVTHDPADNPFKSIAENLLAVRAEKVTPNKADNEFPRLRYLKATGASEGVPQDGGVLLDPTLSAEIIKPIHEEGPFSADARKLPVSGNSNYGWINGVDETSRVTGSRWGGIRGYRIAEAATKTASKPTFRRINWELKEFAAVVVATDQLLADASMFSEIVRVGVTEELKFMLNDDMFNGVGTAGPQGFMNSGALITVTRTTGSKILGEDISAMYNRMDLRGRKSAKWYIGNDSSPQLDNLFAVGSTAVLYPYASIGMDGVKRLYGRPIEITEFNETLNTSGDIVFADMNQYLLWERGGIEEAKSIHVYFLSDETAFRFVYRVDGKASVNTALTPLKGSTTTSPFVALTTAT